MIPQCNPKAGYLSNKSEIDKAVLRVLDSGNYILGEEVKAFEKEFAKFIGSEYAIGVASGTDALELALRAYGIGVGDRVVTVSHTAVATVSAIERCGAIPLFVDIDLMSYTMSSESLCELLDNSLLKNIKAVIPVHLYGCPSNIESIKSVCSENKLVMIEDCSQAHGAAISGKKVGSFGEFGAFSLYPTKNLGALGDAGILVCQEHELYKKIQMLRQYGWKERYISCISGINSRLDEIQAAILRVKLKFIEQENIRRQEIAALYSRNLKCTSLILPQPRSNITHVYHQYVVRHPQRDNLKMKLHEKGIGTLVHYPLPVHLQPAYRDIPRLVVLDNTEIAANEVLSLPLYPQLSNDEIDKISEALIQILAS